MMISGREARLRLGHVGVTDRRARSVLDAGLAGPVVLTNDRHLYGEGFVDALLARPVVSTAQLADLCPTGWFVARRADAAGPGLTPESQRRLLEIGWDDMSVWTRLELRIRIDQHGPLPFLATLAGFVYLGADLVDCGPGGRLKLAHPGPWYRHLLGTRVPTGPGRPWHVRLPGRATARGHDGGATTATSLNQESVTYSVSKPSET